MKEKELTTAAEYTAQHQIAKNLLIALNADHVFFAYGVFPQVTYCRPIALSDADFMLVARKVNARLPKMLIYAVHA
jgi:hypothetical protein